MGGNSRRVDHAARPLRIPSRCNTCGKPLCRYFIVWCPSRSFTDALSAGRNDQPGEARLRVSLRRSLLEESDLMVDMYKRDKLFA